MVGDLNAVTHQCESGSRWEVFSDTTDAALRSAVLAAVSLSQSGTAQPGVRDAASVGLSRCVGPASVTFTFLPAADAADN